MTGENKTRLMVALDNAAEMIRGHVEVGLEPEDVSEEKKDFCCKARSATEGFIAVAKNLRGFGLSLYKGFKGDRIWSLLCQTAYNLKKFIRLLKTEKLEEQSLVKLNLA